VNCYPTRSERGKWQSATELHTAQALTLYGHQQHSTILKHANICIGSREILNHAPRMHNHFKCLQTYFEINTLFLFGCFTMLSVSKLQSVNNRLINECGAVGGMRTGRGNEITRRKPASVPLRPPQILHELSWNWTRLSAVASQRLTAWAMALQLYYQVYSWKRNFSFDNSHLLIAMERTSRLNINSKLGVLMTLCYGDLNTITDNTF
jgi:hypothetical protein